MSELPVMPDLNEPNQSSRSALESKSMSCAGGCENHQTLTAMFYTPVLLLFGGFAALATFPEIAEYAAPWIDEPVAQHVCPSVVGVSTGSNSCGLTTGCSNSGCSTSVAAEADHCEGTVCPGALDATMTPNESSSKEEFENSSEVTSEEALSDTLSSGSTDPSANTSN